MTIEITKVMDSNQRANIVKEVLLDLPEWFGLPESTQAYIDEARELTMFVAKVDSEIAGFITLGETSVDCAELHAIGVKKYHQRQGIGQLLYNAFEQEAALNFKLIQVKTVDEGRYKEYDQKIAFYEKMGFMKVEVLPTLWDEWNPCLILMKPVH